MKAHGIYESQTQATRHGSTVLSNTHSKAVLGENATPAATKRKGKISEAYPIGPAMDDDEEFTPFVKAESTKRVKLRTSEAQIEAEAFAPALGIKTECANGKEELSSTDSGLSTEVAVDGIKREPVNDYPWIALSALIHGSDSAFDDGHNNLDSLAHESAEVKERVIGTFNIRRNGDSGVQMSQPSETITIDD